MGVSSVIKNRARDPTDRDHNIMVSGRETTAPHLSVLLPTFVDLSATCPLNTTTFSQTSLLSLTMSAFIYQSRPPRS
jgi:hypothetical protein